MLYLGIFLFVLFLIIIIPVNITLKLDIENKALAFDARFYILKGIRVFKKSIEIPDILDPEKKEKDINEEAKVKKKKNKKRVENKKVPFFNKMDLIINLYYTNNERIKKIKAYIHKKFKLRNINISIVEGTGDAAQTGLLYGTIWSFIGTIGAVLSNYLNVTFDDVDVQCDYNNKTIKGKVSCIFSVSIANIIFVFLRLNYIIKKYKLNIKSMIGGVKIE